MKRMDNEIYKKTYKKLVARSLGFIEILRVKVLGFFGDFECHDFHQK